MSFNSQSTIRTPQSTCLPEEVEAYRDVQWRREPEQAVETVTDAERWIEQLGFCGALTDARQPGPSLYIAVAGRRDTHMPRNVQKDPESSFTWQLKDEVMRRGRIYYAKLAKGRAFFIAPRLVPFFNALWGLPRRSEPQRLTPEARTALKILRRESELATRDWRQFSSVTERAKWMRTVDELQRTMKVLPSDVLYTPSFTYIWTLAEHRFPAALKQKVSREEALREIARAYLNAAGMTWRGELAKATGLSRPDAGLGNRALVAEGYGVRVATGVYRLADLELRLRDSAMM